MEKIDNLVVIIMAGGLGKRMNSTLPKVLHPINGTPMICKIIDQAQLLNPDKIFIIVGKYKTIIEETIKNNNNHNNIQYIIQEEALGTGHALLCCRDELLKLPSHNVLILSGDVPLISSETMRNICSEQNSIVVTSLDDPSGYGRIIENSNNEFQKIVEEKDCNDDERSVKKVNCGIYYITSCNLCEYLPQIKNNNSQGEYYLTDIIEIIKNNSNHTINTIQIPKDKQHEIMGVNTAEQLQDLQQRTHGSPAENYVFRTFPC